MDIPVLPSSLSLIKVLPANVKTISWALVSDDSWVFSLRVDDRDVAVVVPSDAVLKGEAEIVRLIQEAIANA